MWSKPDSRPTALVLTARSGQTPASSCFAPGRLAALRRSLLRGFEPIASSTQIDIVIEPVLPSSEVAATHPAPRRRPKPRTQLPATVSESSRVEGGVAIEVYRCANVRFALNVQGVVQCSQNDSYESTDAWRLVSIRCCRLFMAAEMAASPISGSKIVNLEANWPWS
jgi:hypothetical protein